MRTPGLSSHVLSSLVLGVAGCGGVAAPRTPTQADRAVIVVAPPTAVPSRCEGSDGGSPPRRPGAFVAWRAGEGDRDAACREVCAPQLRPGEHVVDCEVAAARPGVTYGCEGAACGASWKRNLARAAQVYCDAGGGPAAQPEPFSFTPHDALVVCQVSQ